MLTEVDKQLIIDSFRCGGAGFSYCCNCGRTYVDTYNTGYNVKEEERERILSKPKTTGVRWAVQLIGLEGRIYCDDCDCWHDRASLICEWLRNNQEQIGKFFRIEKQRLLSAASLIPSIGE